MKAAVLVESLTGNTWRAGERIADLLQQEGWSITGLDRVKRPDLTAIQAADLVIVGTWVDGLFVVGQKPRAVNRIANLPTMKGKRAAAFCTYALNPGRTVDKLVDALGDTGADVIGGLAIVRSKLDEHADVFTERLLDATAALT